eukprot:CAMPEP_0168623438 /NCGR_PEP_ID=MMETSP0449_2-20121227/8826_1 /TAXON_ID=1082188 /ORGANISM="Strombidium rassoulzadegani, Strain ras09" /LENGTH=92 /DNA_ID=CAMNT_0008664821 /DNA_START=48 /DNA_END=323 /DNA_ORIENTATION=+
MVGGESSGLHGEGGSITAVVAGAPTSSLASSGSPALPGEFALLGTEEVVGLGELAVVGVSSRVPVELPVIPPDHLGVVEVEEVELVVIGLSR